MVPGIPDRTPYFWKVTTLFSNKDNWHESFSHKPKLYAKEHTIHFQKKQDPGEKKDLKKPTKHQTAHTKTPPKTTTTNHTQQLGCLYCLIQVGSRGEKNFEKDQTSWRLGFSSQALRNLLKFCLQTSEFRNFGSFPLQQKAEL